MILPLTLTRPLPYYPLPISHTLYQSYSVVLHLFYPPIFYHSLLVLLLGDVYYFNLDSSESLWDLPAFLKVPFQILFLLYPLILLHH